MSEGVPPWGVREREVDQGDGDMVGLRSFWWGWDLGCAWKVVGDSVVGLCIGLSGFMVELNWGLCQLFFEE